MLPPRILGLLVLLLAVQGLCKPTKSTEDVDYEGDTPFDEEDEEDEDEEADNSATVEVPPRILSEPKSLRVTAGSTVQLPCAVVHTENYAIAWMKDDKYLYFGSQAQIEDDKRIERRSDNSLVIHNVTVEDSSENYKCTILRNPDPIDLIHRLQVERPQQGSAISPPQHSHKGIIRVIPSKKLEVNEGESIQLGCETNIQPSPEIKWFKENKKLDSYDPNVILNGNYIAIKKVDESHSSRYQCLAEDGSKTPPMEAINVIVHYKPKIELEKSIVNAGTGMESELTCIVSGYPQPVIIWYRDDKQLIHKKGSLLIQHRPIMKSNKTKHILKIVHTKEKDFGVYKCRAENTLGDDIKFITLTGAPSQAMVYGAEVTNDDAGIILKWRLESYSPISEYKLQYRRKDDKEWNVVEPEVKDGKGNQFMVEYPFRELQPGPYEAILMAKNEFGWSTSESHTFIGDYPPDLALKGNSATVRSSGTLLTLILVVLSCAFTSL